MKKEEPRGLNTGQTVIAVLIVASIASLAGWGWWNGAGPFRERSPPPPPAVVVDLLDGVQFMRADVAFEPFADFRIVSDWNKVGQRSSEWTGKELQSLPPLHQAVLYCAPGTRPDASRSRHVITNG